LHC
jgi:hypothetical protein